MTSAIRNLKKFRPAITKVVHSNELSEVIPAGRASAAPPLGPKLGEKGINITHFCKDFNERTRDMKEGVPLPVRVAVNPDRSYNLVLWKPEVEFYLRQAAGCEENSPLKGQIVGKMTLKHIYEIAKLKSTDFWYETTSLEKICQDIIYIAFKLGIQVVPKLDPKEYHQFLEQRRKLEAELITEKEATTQSKSAK